MEPTTFPTLGAAVLYLNSFHHGSNLERLNFIAKHEPEWIFGTANGLWLTRETLPADPSALLSFSIKEKYVKTFNEQIETQC